MDTYRIRVILISALIRVSSLEQAKSSLEQGQVSGGPAAQSPRVIFSESYPRIV